MGIKEIFPNVEVLIYAEDPGTANYVANLPSALTAQGVRSVLLTDGLATNYLAQRGIAGQVVSPADTASRLIKSYKPRMVIAGTSENIVSLGLELITEARQSGITTLGVIDLGVNSDRRFRGKSNSPLTYAPEWLLVPDRATKSSYQSLGFSANHIIACGHPHYDYVRGVAAQLSKENQCDLRRQVLPEAPTSSPIIVFVAEPQSQLNPGLSLYSSSYNFKGRGNTNNRTKIILQELLHVLSLCTLKPYFVLRLHPKNNVNEFQEYIGEVDFVSVGVEPLKVIWAADLIIGMTSMLLQEAAVLGKQTLAVLPRLSEKSWLPVIKSGITQAVTTRKGLQKAIIKWLEEWQAGIEKPSPDTTLVFPPGSQERVVDFILQKLDASVMSKSSG